MGCGRQLAWAAGVVFLVVGAEARADGPRETKTVAMGTAPTPIAAAGEGVGAAVEMVRAAAPVAEDPCTAVVVSQPSRPMWTAGAQTTQCGVMENDLGWHWMALGGGVHQRGATSTERYGITRSLDVTLSLPMRLVQTGGGTDMVGGISDQSLSAMFEFLQQGRRVPAMAVSYGVTIPTANPAKGFGTGYADHQLVFLASRDVRELHFDFNLAGTLAGGPDGYAGAAQSGLVMTVPVRKNVGWILETDGGPQPGTADRLGQTLTGFSWAIRPNLVVDMAYTRGWTGGAPRQQFTMGVTWAHRLRPGLLPSPARLMPGR
jgi:hypothetical protein